MYEALVSAGSQHTARSRRRYFVHPNAALTLKLDFVLFLFLSSGAYHLDVFI